MSDLPATLNSEQELIRSIVANADVLGEVSVIVSADDFLTVSGIAYRVLLQAWLDGETIDPTTITALFEKAGVLDDIGGISAVLDMATGMPSQAEFHAKEVHRNGALWRLKLLATGLSQRAQSPGAEPTEIQAWLDGEITNNTDDGDSKISELSEVLDETLTWLNEDDDEPRLPTGFPDLDNMMNGGMGQGQMIVVAARPGRGKSVLAVDISRHVALRLHKNVAFFSLEMSKREVMLRILAAETNTRLSNLMRHEATPEDWTRLSEHVEELMESNFYIDDDPNLTMVDIKSKTRRLSHRHPLDLVVIDYLQLLSSGKDYKDRQHEVSDMSRQVKLLAKELGCPIIAVAQLNRNVEQRGEDATPKLSDLRESGSLEQDADMVLMINRPDAEDMDHARAGEADFLVVKNRAGRIGTVKVAHQLHFAKFANFVPPTVDYLTPKS